MINFTEKEIKDLALKFLVLVNGELVETRNEYYNSRNTAIMERRKLYYSVEYNAVMDDCYKANNKIASGFFPFIVNQKIDYLINNRLTVEGDEVFDKEYLVELLTQAGRVASIQGRAIYKFEIVNNKLYFRNIPNEQILLSNPDEAFAVHIYKKTSTKLEIKQDLQSIQQRDMIYIDVYENDEVTKYTLYKDYLKLIEVTKNFENFDYEFPPFITLCNNLNCDSDLTPIKTLIDLWDKTVSDYGNNFEDFQDAYMIIKNFIGNNKEMDRLLRDVKRYKILPLVGDDTSADFKTFEIPHEARNDIINLIEKNIYKFGNALNPDDIEGDITNVRIKALYANLDLKTNQFENEIRKFYQKIVALFEKVENRKIESKLIFSRSIIINEKESLDANKNQIGVISDETRISEHLWVDDPAEELKRMERERYGEVKV